MAWVTIRISTETQKKLLKLGSKGQTYEDIIKKVLQKAEAV